jgi:hypothetical protein
MKLVIRTLIFHLFCIIVFSILYFNFAESFIDVNNRKKTKKYLDFFSLSTTIQSGVGLTYLEPVDIYGKFAVLLQQLVLISSYVITLYIFTL